MEERAYDDDSEKDMLAKNDQVEADMTIMEVDDEQVDAGIVHESLNEIGSQANGQTDDEWEDIEDEDDDDGDNDSRFEDDYEDYEVFLNDEDYQDEMKRRSVNYYDMGRRSLSELNENAFSGYQHISELILSENCIQTLKAGVFSTLGNLKRLDLSQNFLIHFEATCFAGLSNLLVLDLRENLIERVDLSIYNQLQSLKICDLSINQLVSINGDNFLGLKNLSMLDLADNSLTKIDLAMFMACPKLTELYLNNNQLSQGVDFSGGVSSYFTKTFITSCESQSRCERRLDCANLTRRFEQLCLVSLDGNPLRRIDCFTFFGLGNVRHLSVQNEQGLDGSPSPFTTSLSPNTFFYFNQLSRLILSGVRFENVQVGTFNGLHTLIYLSMAHCDLDHIEDGLFGNLVNLKKLNLSGNPLRTVSCKLFMGLTSLQGVSLADCQLKKLPELKGLVLDQLNHLHLHNNEFESISASFIQHVPSIRVMTLHNDDDDKSQFKSFSLGSVSYAESYYFSEDEYLNIKKEKFLFDLNQFLAQFSK